jgi:hypothetical protein
MTRRTIHTNMAGSFQAATWQTQLQDFDGIYEFRGPQPATAKD